MYWMYGEGLGSDVGIAQLQSLLHAEKENLQIHIDLLLEDDYISKIEEDGREIKYKLTDFGRKEGGQRFAGAFQGLQKAGHGECGPDCDCQWEGKESCQHHIHHENCDH